MNTVVVLSSRPSWFPFKSLPACSHNSIKSRSTRNLRSFIKKWQRCINTCIPKVSVSNLDQFGFFSPESSGECRENILKWVSTSSFQILTLLSFTNPIPSHSTLCNASTWNDVVYEYSIISRRRILYGWKWLCRHECVSCTQKLISLPSKTHWIIIFSVAVYGCETWSLVLTEEGHVTRMAEMRNAYKILAVKLKWKRSLGRHSHT
jgi:hypothetical protein